MSITVFQILEKITLEELETKLKKIKPRKEKKINSVTGELEDLIISIEDIKKNEKHIQGTMKYDDLNFIETRDGTIPIITTNHADFTFMCGSGIFLLINKNASDSRIVKQNFALLAFLTQPPSILPCDITPPVMSRFIEDNNCDVFNCSWDELDIPRIDKTNLRGAGINNTQDFRRYDNHGQKKSVMFNFPEENVTLSINRQASVHFYTGWTRDQQESFMRTQILPLCR